MTVFNSVKMRHLFKLLRPEFVRNYSKPLNADVFSKFIRVDLKSTCIIIFLDYMNSILATPGRIWVIEIQYL